MLPELFGHFLICKTRRLFRLYPGSKSVYLPGIQDEQSLQDQRDHAECPCDQVQRPCRHRGSSLPHFVTCICRFSYLQKFDWLTFLLLFLRGSPHSYTLVENFLACAVLDVGPSVLDVSLLLLASPNTAVKFSSALARLLCCCVKCHDQKQLWEGWVYLAYQTLSNPAGTQDTKPGWAGTCKQELMQRP